MGACEMAEHTKIEWARHPATGLGATWNIVTGCSVVSPGCTNCYAMKLAGTRLKHHPSREGLTVDTKAGPVWNGTVRFNEQWLLQPMAWKKPHGIFVAAHGDLFAEGITDDQLDRIFAVMALTPQHIYYVLTKRPERMRAYLSAPHRDAKWLEAIRSLSDNEWDEVFASTPLPNVWLGVSVEDQARANDRIPILLDTPAAMRFISAEPLLGPLDLTQIRRPSSPTDRLYPNDLGATYWVNAITGTMGVLTEKRGRFTYDKQVSACLDWIIAGGESGSGARPSHPDWFRGLRDQCTAAAVPFFFKQWGVWHEAVTDWRDPDGNHHQADPDNYEDLQLFDPKTDKLISVNGALFTPQTLPPDIPARLIERIGKKAAGRPLDGIEHTAWPELR